MATKHLRMDELPEVIAAQDEVNALALTISDKEAERVALYALLSGSQRKLADELLLETAAALVAGAPVATRASESSMQEQLGRLSDEIAILRRALVIKKRDQQAVITTASKRIAEQYRAEHQELVRRIAAAAVDLARLSDHEVALRGQLDEQGCNYLPVIRPMPFPLIGSLSAMESIVRAYLREARENGFAVEMTREERLEHLEVAA